MANVFGISNDDMDIGSSPRSSSHRRSRSDPTDLMQGLRAERSQWGGAAPLFPVASTAKRDLSPGGWADFELDVPKRPRPAPLRYQDGVPLSELEAELFSQPSPEEIYSPVVSEGGSSSSGKTVSKKDVPMWTVEEDLLIMQLVEQHGKRWSKIAARLPGRTDNGVRNRWNRMERAQVLRQARGTEAGYRCRRCGQPKRGHICAALTAGATPEGEALTQKAEALSKLSATRMRPPSADGDSEATSGSIDASPQLFSAAPPDVPSPAPLPPPHAHVHALAQPSSAALRTATGGSLPLVVAGPPLAPPHLVAQPSPVAMLPYAADSVPVVLPPPLPSPAARQSSVGVFDDAQLDDFLEELQLVEAGVAAAHAAPAGAPTAAALSQAAMQQLLASFGNPDAFTAPPGLETAPSALGRVF